MFQVECVGAVSGGGLVCMGWSPEQDLAVFVTGEENLLLMTKDFDPICETPAHPEEFGEGESCHMGRTNIRTVCNGIKILYMHELFSNLSRPHHNYSHASDSWLG